MTLYVRHKSLTHNYNKSNLSSIHYFLDTILNILHESNDLIVITHSYELYFIYGKTEMQRVLFHCRRPQNTSGCTEIETVLRKERMVIVRPML